MTGKELDRSVHQQLRTLSKENAEGVAQHLVMVAALLEVDDLESAEAHAETAVRRAGRVPAAREALGLVAYRKGEWARALSEFRTARRLSGSSHMLPLMVDCERGLGRPERALELAMSPEAKTLAVEERVELAIVISGHPPRPRPVRGLAAGAGDPAAQGVGSQAVDRPAVLRLRRGTAARSAARTTPATGSRARPMPTTSWRPMPLSGWPSSTGSSSPTCSTARRTTTRAMPPAAAAGSPAAMPASGPHLIDAVCRGRLRPRRRGLPRAGGGGARRLGVVRPQRAHRLRHQQRLAPTRTRSPAHLTDLGLHVTGA